MHHLDPLQDPLRLRVGTLELAHAEHQLRDPDSPVGGKRPHGSPVLVAERRQLAGREVVRLQAAPFVAARALGAKHDHAHPIGREAASR